MKKLLTGVAIGLLIAFIAIQFYRPKRTNPRVDRARTMHATMNVPPNVDAILERSCNDCHSSNTVWPWYSHVAPMSWILADHVREGRQELSFSELGSYSERKKAHKFEEICEQVTKGEMPVKEYVWLHPRARLSAADVQTLCAWAEPFATPPK